MTGRATPGIRIIPELRAVHLERLAAMAPVQTLFFSTNFDLAGQAVQGPVRRVGLVSAMTTLVRSRTEVLELPEPLWMRFLPKNLCLGAVWKISGRLRRRPRRVVTYAMENNDFDRLIGGRRRPPRPLVMAARLVVGGFLRLVVDRIAFATPASQRLYASLPGMRSVEQRMALELPGRWRQSAGAETQTGAVTQPCSVVFVGAFEARKGVTELLAAWQLIEATEPAARLTLAGGGPMAEVIDAWVAEQPSTRTNVGLVKRDAVHRLVAASAVLVAPSVRDGRWREQVGLPLKEALSVGTAIVTTDETGLAEWLSGQGHDVVPTVDGAVEPMELAAAVLRAMGDASPEARERRMRDLPSEDARLTSDRWLHRPF